MPLEYFKPHDAQKKGNALKLLENSVKDGKPCFSRIAKQTGISLSTLERWWFRNQLELNGEMKSRFQSAIVAILNRIEKLSEETNNLKELAPVVKMLSELLHQVKDGEESDKTWG